MSSFLQRMVFRQFTVLHAEILGVDKDSYFHVDIIEPGLRDLYHEMMDEMALAVKDQPHMERNVSRQPGIHCLVKVSGRRGGNVVRGSVVQAVENTEYLFCYLIDDFEEAIVHFNQIFHTTEEIMKYPVFILKCKLSGMDCFVGDQCLKRVYAEYIKTAWKMGCNRCTLEVLGNQSISPTVRMTTSEGKDLTEDLQQLLPIAEGLKYSPIGEPVSATILHCDEQGIVWYRPYYENQSEGGLNEVIKRKLHSYLNQLVPKPNENFENYLSFNHWKLFYAAKAGEVFIYVSPQKDRCYRVIILNYNEWNIEAVERRLTVLFIDYGYLLTVFERDLRPAYLVDPILCYIPPQCLPFKFAGAVCSNGEDKKFNCRKFWKFLAKSKISVVIKQFGNEFINNSGFATASVPPIGDIFIRNPTPYAIPGHIGYSLGEVFQLTECGCQYHYGYSTLMQHLNIVPMMRTAREQGFEQYDDGVMYSAEEFYEMINWTINTSPAETDNQLYQWKMESDWVNWAVTQFYTGPPINNVHEVAQQVWSVM